jgi:hypothetical protein
MNNGDVTTDKKVSSDFLTIRLYAHTQGDALAVCRQQVGQGPVEAPAPRDGQRDGEGWGEAQPERCPVCGQRLVCTALIPRAGVPPPAEAVWEQVA